MQASCFLSTNIPLLPPRSNHLPHPHRESPVDVPNGWRTLQCNGEPGSEEDYPMGTETTVHFAGCRPPIRGATTAEGTKQ